MPKDDPDPKALACYGILVRWATEGEEMHEEAWLRFVDGRPVSAVTTPFLEWCCAKLKGIRKKALLLVWDNASWHKSQMVRDWTRDHNRKAKQEGKGVRVLACLLPIKSPWLNPIEPKWVHGKRRVAQADGLLPATELAQRVCDSFGCPHEPHLSIPKPVP